MARPKAQEYPNSKIYVSFTPHNLTLWLGRRILAAKMSVIERIKQIQAAIQQKPEESALEKSREQKLQAMQRAKEEAEIQRKEARAKFITQETDRIMKESGTLNGLCELDSEISKQKHINFYGRVDDHSLVYEPERGRALLVWGYGYQICSWALGGSEESWHFGIGEPFQSSVYDKDVVASSPKEKEYVYSFAYIEVHVDVDNKTIQINDCVLENKQWKSKDLVETTLARTFLEPKRKKQYELASLGDFGDDGRSMN